MTVPATGSATSRFTTVTFRPDSASVAVALACDSPVTSGTLTSWGPLDTNTVTGPPTCTAVSAGGSVAITRPLPTELLDWLWVVGWKPFSRRIFTASTLALPSTFGRARIPGPEDTTTLTCVPFLTFVPLGGVVPTTRPLATRALAASDTAGESPSRCSDVTAAAWVSPLTLGTVTWPVAGSSVSSNTTAAAIASAATPAAIHSARLRRREAAVADSLPSSDSDGTSIAAATPAEVAGLPFTTGAGAGAIP